MKRKLKGPELKLNCQIEKNLYQISYYILNPKRSVICMLQLIGGIVVIIIILKFFNIL